MSIFAGKINYTAYMSERKCRMQDIHLNQDNPRTITKDAFEVLVNSLLIFPKGIDKLMQIAVDENGMILAGNMRYTPYRNTAEYLGGFDTNKFDDWLRTRDFPVYVSEYSMPSDFERIAVIGKTSILCPGNRKQMLEGIYLHKRWIR